jgi:ribosomal protein L7/L12
MPEQSDEFVDLVVLDDGPRRLGVYKLIEQASALEITQVQAGKLFRSGQHPVIPGIPKDQADALKVEFDALGATVELRPATPPSDG